MADNSDKYVIDIISDEKKRAYLNDAQSAIDNLRKKIAELQQMISGNIGLPIMNKAPEVVFYIKNAIGIPNRDSQMDVTNGEEDESYYIRFIPINKQDVVIDLRTSDHIRGEEWSNRKDGGKHPNIRASAIVQDTESLTPTAETQKAHKVNGCRIKRITQKIPAKVYGTPEQAIKHLNTLICLFQNGKFGKYKENNKNKRLNCNRNMKQTIRLTENELRGMINEAVKKALQPTRTRRPMNENRNKTNRLTESELRGMINEAVKQAINEIEDFDERLPKNDKYTIERVPDWALGYLINGDASYLEDEDIAMIDDWQRRSGVGTVVCPNDDDQPYFTSHPAFGKACDVYDCICLLA